MGTVAAGVAFVVVGGPNTGYTGSSAPVSAATDNNRLRDDKTDCGGGGGCNEGGDGERRCGWSTNIAKDPPPPLDDLRSDVGTSLTTPPAPRHVEEERVGSSNAPLILTEA